MQHSLKLRHRLSVVLKRQKSVTTWCENRLCTRALPRYSLQALQTMLRYKPIFDALWTLALTRVTAHFPEDIRGTHTHTNATLSFNHVTSLTSFSANVIIVLGVTDVPTLSLSPVYQIPGSTFCSCSWRVTSALARGLLSTWCRPPSFFLWQIAKSWSRKGMAHEAETIRRPLMKYLSSGSTRLATLILCNSFVLPRSPLCLSLEDESSRTEIFALLEIDAVFPRTCTTCPGLTEHLLLWQ